jgi:GntR family transcriptional repressor for pyruvate dehydrogenase complex
MARKHRDVMGLLIAEIVSGGRAAGSMLPREVDLAAEFEVSRGVARETIRAMEERGLIEVRHGRGATVNEPGRWDVFDPDVLAATLESEHEGDVLAEYLECRRILEVEAAGLAADRARKRDVERLTAALTRMEDIAERPVSTAVEERFVEADIAFHQSLIAASGNHALARLVERLHSAMLLARVSSFARMQYRTERALPEHRRVLAAVRAGDAAEAREAMSDHLDTIAGYLDEHRRQRRSDRRGRR